MTSFGLNPNGLLDSSAELASITNSIQQAIDELNSAVAVYIQANSGETSSAFQHAQTTWSAGITTMKQSLEQANRSLNEIHDRYRLGDAKGAALFSGNV